MSEIAPSDEPGWVWEGGVRVLTCVVEWHRRRTMLGWQRPCPRCGAGIGQRCVRPSGVELRYVTSRDEGHHSERVPEMPRNGWYKRERQLGRVGS